MKVFNVIIIVTYLNRFYCVFCNYDFILWNNVWCIFIFTFGVRNRVWLLLYCQHMKHFLMRFKHGNISIFCLKLSYQSQSVTKNYTLQYNINFSLNKNSLKVIYGIYWASGYLLVFFNFTGCIALSGRMIMNDKLDTVWSKGLWLLELWRCFHWHTLSTYCCYTSDFLKL
jgi:hypothetical protein